MVTTTSSPSKSPTSSQPISNEDTSTSGSSGIIGGYAFLDTNNDGNRDTDNTTATTGSSEESMSNVNVQLYTCTPPSSNAASSFGSGGGTNTADTNNDDDIGNHNEVLQHESDTNSSAGNRHRSNTLDLFRTRSDTFDNIMGGGGRREYHTGTDSWHSSNHSRRTRFSLWICFVCSCSLARFSSVSMERLVVWQGCTWLLLV